MVLLSSKPKPLSYLKRGARGWAYSFLKNWTLPIAIATGTLSYLIFAYVPELDCAATTLSPVFDMLLPLTIFMTLFITFSKVDFHLMKLRKWHFCILAMQLLLVALLVIIAQSSSPFFSAKLILEAVLICIIAPIALRFPWPTKPFDNLLTLLHHPFIYAYFLNNYCFFFVFSSYVFFDYFIAQSIEEPFFYYCGILCKYSS